MLLLSYIIFLIGFLGFIFNRKSLILLFITIEIMLLGITVQILNNSYLFDDSTGLVWAIIVIILAGAESAIGLSLLVCYYRLRGHISLDA